MAMDRVAPIDDMGVKDFGYTSDVGFPGSHGTVLWAREGHITIVQDLVFLA